MQLILNKMFASVAVPTKVVLSLGEEEICMELFDNSLRDTQTYALSLLGRNKNEQMYVCIYACMFLCKTLSRLLG